MKDGEISLTERFAQKQYVYPRRIYEGMEFFIDIDTLTAQSVWVQGEFDINFHKVVDRFCPDGATYISPATSEVEEILTKLWSLSLIHIYSTMASVICLPALTAPSHLTG